MKVKTSDLIGAALDWAVAKCEGFRYELYEHNRKKWENGLYRPQHWQPSTNWAQGGPIKTRERISTQIKHDGWWVACIYNVNDDPTYMKLAHSELVAAMRCYVASKLGDEVDIPNELA